MIGFLSNLALAVALIMFIVMVLTFGFMIILTIVGFCMEAIQEIREGSEE